MGALRTDLEGKVALVSGGGRGIGRAIALALAENGAHVAVSSRTTADLEETCRLVGLKGADCVAIKADVSDVSQVRNMVEQAFGWKGRLDILVNSAGINIQRFALDVSEEDWDKVIDVNLKGTFFACQAAGKKMIPQGGGKIINVTSQMSFVGFYKRAAYCASKGGVTQLTKVLAVEWAPHKINVNCIAPTFVLTPLTEPMFKDREFYDEVLRRIPMGKLATLDDVADAAVYLASRASDMVTGSTILVDGGWVAW